MGWFKKKSDPINERARALNQQIAELEAQIKQLSEQQSAAARQEVVPVSPPPQPVVARPSPDQLEPAPKLRSTALPHGHPRAASGAGAVKSGESGLEDLGGNPFKGPGERGGQKVRDLGTAQSDFSGLWKRFKRQFRAPATSNPKLVSYLAAGSIQGLRPLRYEKRVARNRTILLLVCLILILWGILAIVIR
jgi:hypothetical protein